MREERERERERVCVKERERQRLDEKDTSCIDGQTKTKNFMMLHNRRRPARF